MDTIVKRFNRNYISGDYHITMKIKVIRVTKSKDFLYLYDGMIDDELDMNKKLLIDSFKHGHLYSLSYNDDGNILPVCCISRNQKSYLTWSHANIKQRGFTKELIKALHTTINNDDSDISTNHLPLDSTILSTVPLSASSSSMLESKSSSSSSLMTIKDDWASVDLQLIDNGNDFWSLYDSIDDDFYDYREQFLNAYYYNTLYGLRVSSTEEMKQRMAYNDDIFCKGSNYLLPIFASVVNEEKYNICALVWTHKRARGHGFGAYLLSSLNITKVERPLLSAASFWSHMKIEPVGDRIEGYDELYHRLQKSNDMYKHNIINPLTNRKIVIGGGTYLKLVKSGNILQTDYEKKIIERVNLKEENHDDHIEYINKINYLDKTIRKLKCFI